MLEEKTAIVNQLGMHARAAAKFVNLASKFESDIQLSRESRKVNGKSIMGVLMLAASQGTEITLHINGPDEEAALTALIELVGNGFGEMQPPA